jgi:hypothetical protein
MRRQLRSPSRWTWVLPLSVAALVAACDTSFEGINNSRTWGFITVGATESTAGAHFADIEGLFFAGDLASVPNAEFTVADTCADGVLVEGNNLVGVTYLDAGPSVSATLGGVAGLLDRTNTASGIAYLPASPLAYTPGDSIIVDVAGVTGGFPAGTIRAKTAEPFDFPTDIDIPAGTEAIQLTWTPPQDPRSAIVVSLRYATITNPGVETRNIVCSFIDDGADSIKFEWHQNWSSSSGVRSVVATRLRTHYVAAGDANLGVISIFQRPTPPNP